MDFQFNDDVNLLSNDSERSGNVKKDAEEMIDGYEERLYEAMKGMLKEVEKKYDEFLNVEEYKKQEAMFL